MRITLIMDIWMSTWLWDIEIIIKWFKWLKDKFFPKINRQNESLQQDIVKYFKEFYLELTLTDKKEQNNNWKEILWNTYDELKRMDALITKDFEKKEFSRDQFEKAFKNYMKEWEYGKLFNNAYIKMNSYWSTIKECIENYWNNDWKKLMKERKIFDEFLDENLKKIKEWYIDFILSWLFPKRLDSNSRKDIINKSVDKLDFEKYIPIIKKFLDKIDNRILVK